MQHEIFSFSFLLYMPEKITYVYLFGIFNIYSTVASETSAKVDYTMVRDGIDHFTQEEIKAQRS